MERTYVQDNRNKPYKYKGKYEYCIGIHLTNMCNLFCTCCSHYSNYKLDGYLSVERFTEYMETWADNFNALSLELRLLGGEPTLHKDLEEIHYQMFEVDSLIMTIQMELDSLNAKN